MRNLRNCVIFSPQSIGKPRLRKLQINFRFVIFKSCVILLDKSLNMWYNVNMKGRVINMSKKVYNGVETFVGYKAILEYYTTTNTVEKREIERIHEITNPSKNVRTKIAFIKEYNKSHLNGTLSNSLDSLIDLYKTKKPDEVVVKLNITMVEGQDGYSYKKGTDGTLFLASLFGHNVKLKRVLSFGENPHVPNVERMINRTMAMRNQLWNFEIIVGEDESQQTEEVEKKVVKDTPIATMISGDGSSYRGVTLGGCLEVLVNGYEHRVDGHFAHKSPELVHGYSILPLDGGCWQWRIELNGKPWYYGEDIYRVTVDGDDYHAVKRGDGYKLLWLVDHLRQRDMGTSFRSIITTRWDNVVGECMWGEPSEIPSYHTFRSYYGISPQYSPASPIQRRSAITEDDLVEHIISYDPF